jgi:hypothetical protein
MTEEEVSFMPATLALPGQPYLIRQSGQPMTTLGIICVDGWYSFEWGPSPDDLKAFKLSPGEVPDWIAPFPMMAGPVRLAGRP